MTPMLSSCWTGKGAARRMMNMLSPKMPAATFRQYARWQLGRGCNTVHVILANQGDGEFAGYSPFGPGGGLKLHSTSCRLMLDRMAELRGMGFGVVPWCWTDDSGAFTGRPVKELQEQIRLMSQVGLFAGAGAVVLGLEVNEYWSARQCAELVPVLRQVSGGALVCLHQTSDRIDFSPLSDVCFWQTNPGKKPAAMKKLVMDVVRRLGGKPLVAFELDRKENRALCQAALSAGASGVGNW